MNLEFKIERARVLIARARIQKAPIDELKELEKRLNNLWVRLMAL